MKRFFTIFGIFLAVILLWIVLTQTFAVMNFIYIEDFALSPNGQTMTVRVAVGVSVGYTRSMTVTQEGNAVKLTFHPAYGFINGKIGAKNTFDIPLKPYQDKIYIFPSGHGLIRNEQGQWERQTFNIEL